MRAWKPKASRMRFLRRANKVAHNAPELMSLAPKYSEETHGVYYSMVESALKRQRDVRNIALAGTYGTGKSSILHQVRKKFKKRVVEVSLLSLGAKPDKVDDKNKNVEVNPAAASKTNRIQKEIVKQLLYQQKPTDAPDSRFRRIARFRWVPEIITAVVLALVALVFVAVMGVDVETAPEIKVVFVDRPDGVRVIAAYVIAGILITALVLGVRVFFRGRAAIEKLTAGPATITLPPRSTSYFDEYLDEIIYFFEMNRKVSIVIIEDLDRFDDPHIFESLRSLNNLLNSARQLRRRRIRFIYAMKDSVFGKLGGDEKAPAGDLAQVELSRANRTKFFELIIPVVPFVTHKNARDVLKELLKDQKLIISDDLVDVAARHVADMRLIKNIINEYQVFKNRLLDADRSVPGLDRDRLFAIVLYKNVYVEDFEKIQHGTSQLDTLWTTWRELVRVNTERLHADTNARTRRVSARDAASSHAEKLGTRLREVVVTLAAAPGTGLRSADIHFQGQTVSDETLATPAFWRQYLESQDPLTLTAQSGNSRAGSMLLSPAAVETMTGLRINSDDFVKEASDRDRHAMADNTRELEFLRRHTWSDIVAKPQFTFAKDDEPARSFRGWIDDLFPSKLASDLVINGYLTAYFSLYVSAFYGQIIRPDAMIYVMRHVDSRSADADYVLEPADVDAIIREEGRSVLAERSMLNVSILNHLLRTSDADAATVIGNLPVFDGEGTFRDRYLVAGSEKERFVELLAQISPDVFTVLFDAPLEVAEKVRLLDAAARNRSEDQNYEFSPRLGEFLAEHVASFPTLVEASDDEAVRKVVSVFESSSAVISDVTALAEPVRTALGASQAYVLNTANVTAIFGSDNLSLEKAQEAGEETFLYVLDYMAEYLRIVSGSKNTPYVVESVELFSSVVLQVDWTTEEFRPFIAAAGPDCVINDLTKYPRAAWPALVGQHRAPMTWENVSAYITRLGGVDDDLATALNSVETISDIDEADQAARRDVSMAILNTTSPALDGSRRVTLATDLDPGLLAADNLKPMSGPMVGDLIKGGLLADDEATFASPLMADWPTLAHAILSSTNFPSFIGPRTLHATRVPFVFQDDTYAYLFPQLVPAMRHYAGHIPKAFGAMADRAITGDIELNGEDIEHACKNGLWETKAIDVLAVSEERVPLEQLLRLLRGFGGEWAKVSKRGFGSHKVVASPGAQDVLERLKKAGIVSRTRRDGGSISVSLKQPLKP